MERVSFLPGSDAEIIEKLMARVVRLETKIESQRVELTNLRRKRERVSSRAALVAEQRLREAAEKDKKFSSLQDDIDSLVKDNERLRAEIVRLSGLVKRTERSEVSSASPSIVDAVSPISSYSDTASVNEIGRVG